MFEHSKHVVDRHPLVGHRPDPELLAIPVDGTAPQHATVDRGFGQEGQGGAVAIGAEDELQSALVVVEIHLPANAEHLAGVHALDVLERGDARTVRAPEVLVQAVEEPLHVVGSRLADPSLRGQQRVGSVAYPRLEHVELVLPPEPVEERSVPALRFVPPPRAGGG